MKNIEKYKTPQEQTEAFDRFCAKPCEDCCLCNLDIASHRMGCAFAWLDLEAEEEKLLPCPFCGGELKYSYNDLMAKQTWYKMVCECGYATKTFDTVGSVVAHNRVANAVRESEGKCEN